MMPWEQGGKVLNALRSLATKLERGDHDWSCVTSGYVDVTTSGVRIRLFGPLQLSTACSLDWIELERSVRIDRSINYRVGKAAEQLAESVSARRAGA